MTIPFVSWVKMSDALPTLLNVPAVSSSRDPSSRIAGASYAFFTSTPFGGHVYAGGIITKEPTSRQIGSACGAYGFRITGLDAGNEHLSPAPREWPQLRIETRRGTPPNARPAGTVHVAAEHAEIWLVGGGRIDVRRDPLTVRFTTREPLSADTILHPYLGLPASIASRWLGRHALHGGAFAHAGRAWALLGEREAGKSATLAQLLSTGSTVLSDDILIIDGTNVFAGPRSVDLRAEAAALVGGEPLGVVGSRPRWRLRPPESSGTMPLGGIVELAWGEYTRLEPLDPRARLQALIGSSVLRPRPADAVELLELAALSAWRFVRIPGISGLAPATAQLLAELEA
jgi:hypothetical protein